MKTRRNEQRQRPAPPGRRITATPRPRTALRSTTAGARPGAPAGASNRSVDPAPGDGDGTLDLASAPSDWLGDEVVTLSRHLASDTLAMLRLIGEIDARGAYARWGASSCAAWLADACEIERSTAHRQLRVARAMRTWTALDEAMADGDVSFAKARTIVPHLSDTNVVALVDIARSTPVGRLGAAVAAWLHRHDDPEEIARRHHRERSVSWRTDPDGMVTITARLEPGVAGAVCAVLDTQVMRAPAGAPEADGSRPSLAQQRADALVAAVTAPPAERARGRGRPPTRVDTEVVVHVTAEGNRLTDGTPLGDHAVAALLPDAFVSLLLHDAERQPIDASPRRRFPTRRQRRVVDARQDQCAGPGCTATVFLQYDHVEPYDPIRPNTVIANLQRLCGPHNRAKNPAPSGPEPGRGP